MSEAAPVRSSADGTLPYQERRLGRAEDALQPAAAAAEALERVRLLLARVEEADARERVVRDPASG